MKLSSQTYRWIARLMLGLVLFAQGVLAANACDILGGNVSQAFAVAAADEHAAPCHEEPASNANACLDHCTQGDRVNVAQVTPVFVAPSVVVLVLDVPAVTSLAPAYLAAARVNIESDPPASIRFCSFQI